ncbi:hypothetical protein [Idiomarina xiamenensis]|uniref:Uncharacterized protein n=1 Tax=Idiomarina xiamenensis 10-D-4 TaxID=740709 RepID=K2KX67_9GAMM|nr:hypothetical protein [Idiomarina xiamenensis]EKE87084.1 hypothetical protein A10D4_02552 [Idiomarina xiamenensis 10-D-4]
MAGYNLHIERENQISVEEWLAVCEQDKSLSVQNTAIAVNPQAGAKIKVSTPNSCVWTSRILKKKYSFTYSNGSITFGTDKAQLKKAKKIAQILNAKVVGDEGEEY